MKVNKETKFINKLKYKNITNNIPHIYIFYEKLVVLLQMRL